MRISDWSSDVCSSDLARGEGGPLLTAIEDFWNWFKRQVEKLVENSDALRHLYVTLDYFLTMLRGIIKDDVINKGFDQLDGENFSDWLDRNGVVEGKSVSVRVGLGGRRTIKKTKNKNQK